MGADSLAFLSVDGIYRAMGYAGARPARPQFTDHCFTGDYPTRLTDQDGEPAKRHCRCSRRRLSGRPARANVHTTCHAGVAIDTLPFASGSSVAMTAIADIHAPPQNPTPTRINLDQPVDIRAC